MSTKSDSPRSSQFVERFTRIEDADRSFDLAFWQSQSDAARFAAAWELVVTAHRWKGGSPNELRLQRSVEAFGRASG
ncbi:MAG: hypothetical protein H7062_14760 [Candidatus Saccharimonas sp.]|nr:hypothetical protein [Planctomycetaceae bacterium]